MAATRAIRDEAELREIVGLPNDLVVSKIADRLNDLTRQFVERSPFVCVATDEAGTAASTSRRAATRRGSCASSTSARCSFPTGRATRIADTLTNLLSDDRIALLFLVPGVGDTFRVNGRASRSSTITALLEESAIEGKAPKLGILVTIEEAYTQCAKALIRSELWNADRHVDRSELPSPGELLRSVADPDLDPERLRPRARRPLRAARRLLLNVMKGASSVARSACHRESYREGGPFVCCTLDWT